MRRALHRLFTICLFAFVTPATADADVVAPDRIRGFRFLPDSSTLHVTGGFGGVDERWKLTGGFDLVTGFEQNFPNLDPFAAFTNVTAVAHHPIHDFPWPLDDALNLSGLDGTFDPPNQNFVLFQGFDGQGAPIQLQADIDGRLMRLTGENFPQNHPDGAAADLFHYELNALVLQTPWADFDRDFDVDGDDFLIWQENLGAIFILPGGPGDADYDGDVDGDDFLVWQREFGEASIGSASGAIPEPASAAVGVLLLLGAIGLRIRRKI